VVSQVATAALLVWAGWRLVSWRAGAGPVNVAVRATTRMLQDVRLGDAVFQTEEQDLQRLACRSGKLAVRVATFEQRLRLGA
jgi:hypothetical protein